MSFDIIDTALQALDGYEVNNDWTVGYDSFHGTIHLMEVGMSDVQLHCTPFWEGADGIPVTEVTPEDDGMYYDHISVAYPQTIEEWNEFFDAFKHVHLLAISQKYDLWNQTQKEIAIGRRVWEEVVVEHQDDNGVWHVDGYTNTMADDNGRVIAYIINDEVYYKDDRAKEDPVAQNALREWAEKYSGSPFNMVRWTFNVGDCVKVTTSDIEYLKDLVNDISELTRGELEGPFQDFISEVRAIKITYDSPLKLKA